MKNDPKTGTDLEWAGSDGYAARMRDSRASRKMEQWACFDCFKQSGSKEALSQKLGASFTLYVEFVSRDRYERLASVPIIHLCRKHAQERANKLLGRTDDGQTSLL